VAELSPLFEGPLKEFVLGSKGGGVSWFLDEEGYNSRNTGLRLPSLEVRP